MADLIPDLYQAFIASQGVSTDTRKIESGMIFFALKGENFNGNAYASQALEQGAKLAVVDEIIEPIQANQKDILLVENALATLQQLARHYRRTLAIPLLAIGGSNGKTTTKELIRAALSPSYRTFATPGNLNNHIGVPLSLLAMPQDTEIAIIEMGANHEGEIALLCEIAEPNYGLITNIGKDHLEGFGSLKGVARANGELYDYLLKNKGTIFVNTQEEILVKMASHFTNTFTYPNPGDSYEAQLLPSDFYLKIQSESGEIIDTQLYGEYNFANVASALCVAKIFEVPTEQAHQAVADYVPSNHRSQLIHKRTNTILMDAYNANPSSMQKAVESFGKVKAQTKMVILGDMYELGDQSEAEHRKLGECVAAQSFDTVVFHGKAIQPALQANPMAYYFPDKFSLHNWLEDRKLEHTHILIKGSRGVSLETVLSFI